MFFEVQIICVRCLNIYIVSVSNSEKWVEVENQYAYLLYTYTSNFKLAYSPKRLIN